MTTTALERLRELRREEGARGDGLVGAWPPAGESCPVIPADLAGELEWSQPAADVLALVASADAPVPHPALLRGLMERGWARDKARAAIADCQKRGWIEHDLISGYVLAGG